MSTQKSFLNIFWFFLHGKINSKTAFVKLFVFSSYCINPELLFIKLNEITETPFAGFMHIGNNFILLINSRLYTIIVYF